MSEVDMDRALEVYNDIIDMLDSREWKYDRFDEDLVIKSGIKGEDLPVEFLLFVKPKNQVVQFISKLPFNVPDDMRIDLAVAVNVANYGLVDGSFDYDIKDGDIRYRLTSSYRDSQLGPDLFEYMIMCGASTVDSYNDKFFALCKGFMTINDFIEREKEN